MRVTLVDINEEALRALSRARVLAKSSRIQATLDSLTIAVANTEAKVTPPKGEKK